MRKIYLFLSVLFILTAANCISQTCQDVSVELSAAVQASPPQITLSWVANSNATQYTVYRKLKEDAAWGSAIATLAGTETQYLDNAAEAGISYEYKIVRAANGFTGYGYINAGIDVPAIEQRGVLILVVDNTFSGPLSLEIAATERGSRGGRVDGDPVRCFQDCFGTGGESPDRERL